MASAYEILNSWSASRIRHFLAARGVSEDELVSPSSTSADLALFHASDPIVVREGVTPAVFDTWTHDQLVHWVAVYQNKRINSRGANVFDSSPVRESAEAKRPWFIDYAKKLFEQNVRPGGEQAQRDFDLQVAEVESRPHIFEGHNAVLDREAKYNRHDLRVVLDVFGIDVPEDATRESLLLIAKESTTFFAKGTNANYNNSFAKGAGSFGAAPFLNFYNPSRKLTFEPSGDT